MDVLTYVNIFITTLEELRAIISEAISGILPKTVSNQSRIDTITLTDALELLKEHGYLTSNAKIYKLTSAYRRYLWRKTK